MSIILFTPNVIYTTFLSKVKKDYQALKKGANLFTNYLVLVTHGQMTYLSRLPTLKGIKSCGNTLIHFLFINSQTNHAERHQALRCNIHSIPSLCSQLQFVAMQGPPMWCTRSIADNGIRTHYLSFSSHIPLYQENTKNHRAHTDQQR